MKLTKFTLGLLVSTSLASFAYADAYECFNINTNASVATVSISSTSRTASLEITGVSFEGTYSYISGHCPSRNCGSILGLQVTVANPQAPAGDVATIQGHFGFESGSQGAFDLYTADGILSNHLDVLCK